jgi:hypothetical protein
VGEYRRFHTTRLNPLCDGALMRRTTFPDSSVTVGTIQ